MGCPADALGPLTILAEAPHARSRAKSASRDDARGVEHKQSEVMRAMYEHSDVNDEDLGIRAFQVKRAKAVERAVQLVRQGLGPSWAELTGEEIEEFEWILGELWAYLSHHNWDELHFGLLTMRDVIKILTLGSQLRRHARGSIEILRDVEAIISAETPYSTAYDEQPQE